MPLDTEDRVKESRPRLLLRSALAFPLLWKVLLANASVVVATALVGGALAHRLTEVGESTAGAVIAFAVAGTALSLLVNGVLLRLALEPLAVLERTAARVHGGDLDARAADSPLADPALRRLARTFNAALDGLAASRRRVRLVLARSMEAEEGERRRVARALEDDAAQRLAGLLMRAQLLERYPDPEALAELIRSAKIEIARVLEVVRGYAVQRRPAVLEELGLVAALEAEARCIMQKRGILVKVEGAEPEGLDLEAEVVLYRVLAEALDNAAQHASPRLIGVQFANREDEVIATVEDDGQGFDPGRLEEEAGPGLAAMRERTESAGGRMSLWAVPGEGTRVRFEMPKCASAMGA